MSNSPHLESTTFTHFYREPDYGYTICDDCLEAPVEDDIELLKIAVENGDSILDFCQDNESGIMVNQTWYDWEEIKEYFPS